MKTISRVLVFPVVIVLMQVTANVAWAAGTCEPAVQQVIPGTSGHSEMLSINQSLLLLAQQPTYPSAKAKPLSKPDGAERYQRPVLVDKGICRQKAGGFNKSTIRM